MPEPDLDLIVDAAKRAGAIARQFYGGRFLQWDKGAGEPVTEADLAVDRFLSTTLRGARPDYGWLSEETEDDPSRLAARNVFIVDPIDGTIAFLRGKPQFTIAIAIVRDGRPRAGVVFNPVTEECFAAAEGKGATLNGDSIHVSAQGEIEGCRMLATKSTFEEQSRKKAPWPAMQVEQRSSIAYRMALVAAGQFDAMLSLSAKHDWDLAAGDIIVREAGGRVSDARGFDLRYNGAAPYQHSVVAAGARLHEKLLDKLKTLP
ncbi:MAG TPA: 3'(2'),5'-bisphosphate nucleotidase CysQ [Rhizomicrobium sp.]|nr:3'(2'),5'-bisphosphate nucleotidase CysQ [Rhizomicrobium sp.]